MFSHPSHNVMFVIVTTIFNPAPAVKSLDPQLFVQADITCPNESEVCVICIQSMKLHLNLKGPGKEKFTFEHHYV